MLHKISPFLFLFGVLMLQNCAQVGTIAGGSKDITPPQILVKKSSPNGQKNFKPKQLNFYFDEWVKLNNPVQNIIISPPIKQTAKIDVVNKGIKMLFEEGIWDEATTYKIAFNNAIQDINESNAIKDFNFIFSTGTQIDSGKIIGRVIDWYNKQPIANTAVILYEDMSDSAVFKSQPKYFVTAEKDGSFSFSNLPNRPFKVYAFQDENQNKKWDSLIEKIGFLSQTIQVKDSIINLGEIWLAKQKSVRGVGLKIYTPKGKALITYDQNIKVDSIVSANKNIFFNYQVTKTKIRFEFKSDTLLNNKFLIYFNDGTKDSIDVMVYPIRELKSNIYLDPDNTYLLGNPINIISDFIVDSIRSNLVILNDSSRQVAMDLGETKYSIEIKSLPIGDSISTLVIPAGNLLFQNKMINDSVKFLLKPIKLEDYGNIGIKLNCENSKLPLIIQIIKNEKEIVHEWNIFDKKKELILTSKPLEKANYKIIVIEDENNNGIWDGVSIFQKKVPERIFQKAIDNFKPNWEINISLEIPTIFEQKAIQTN
ncbi:MAG: Ig-like domain-containing protein [Saprospiraceae bacterium]|nr:Ig-like domain-containing protein [Saprospiraceae bacterium]